MNEEDVIRGSRTNNQACPSVLAAAASTGF